VLLRGVLVIIVDGVNAIIGKGSCSLFMKWDFMLVVEWLLAYSFGVLVLFIAWLGEP
jgi:hypothetical protein